MNRLEFCDHMNALLDTMDDNYIEANLRFAVQRYRCGSGRPPPRQPILKGNPGCCYHNIPLEQACDKCAESYGDARPTQI